MKKMKSAPVQDQEAAESNMMNVKNQGWETMLLQRSNNAASCGTKIRM
jgi:hypothetical protein